MDRKEEKSIDLDEKSAAYKYRLLQAQQLIEQMETLDKAEQFIITEHKAMEDKVGSDLNKVARKLGLI